MMFGNQQGPGQPGPGGYGQGRPPAPGGNGGLGPGGFAMHPPQGAGPNGYGQQGPPSSAGYGQQGPQHSGAQKPPGASGYGQQGPQHGGAQKLPGASGYGQQGPPRGGSNNASGVHWVNAADSFIPPNAVQGGLEKDGSPLFVARAIYKGGLHPGKAAQHIQDGGCSIGWGHEEINVREYQILCGDASQLRWVKQKGALSIQGIKLVDAGHEESGKPLYIAKALYEGSQQLGKCAPHIKKGMSFAYGHKERTTDNYLVLAYNH